MNRGYRESDSIRRVVALTLVLDPSHYPTLLKIVFFFKAMHKGVVTYCTATYFHQSFRQFNRMNKKNIRCQLMIPP